MKSALLPAILVTSLVGCDALVKYEPAPPPPPPPPPTSSSSSSSSSSSTAPTREGRPTPPARAFVTPRPAAVDAASSRPATQPVDAGGPAVRWPIAIERFERTPGPIRGVVARVDLTDPRVSVRVALADARDPDGVGPAVGRLETVSRAAQSHGLALAMNASFFKVGGSREALGKRVGYFVGNGAWPVGWHVADGRTVSTPAAGDAAPRATLVVHRDRRVTLDADARELPADAAYAVSGNVKVLEIGIANVAGVDEPRHPRSAVGLSADRNTLFLVVVDGRRDGWSAGATLGELATLMKSLGASDAINLDGGGSSDLVVRDAVTGVYAIANRPSERAALTPGVDSVERPVVDVIGIDVKGD